MSLCGNFKGHYMNNQAITTDPNMPVEVELGDQVTLEEALSEIDDSIVEHEAKVKVAEAIARLKANPDYQLVIEEGYLETEAKRLFDNIVAITPLKRDQLENIVDMMNAIRHFKTFIAFKVDDGRYAVDQIEKLHEYRSQVTAYYAEN